VVSNNQQFIRLEEEKIRAFGAEIVEEVVRRVDENTHEADAIILSDYGKGLLQSGGLTQAMINIGRSSVAAGFRFSWTPRAAKRISASGKEILQAIFLKNFNPSTFTL
jgi:bifunctional ADP-heptose synthase (sugar kinase/adenylyltransferase)